MEKQIIETIREATKEMNSYDRNYEVSQIVGALAREFGLTGKGYISEAEFWQMIDDEDTEQELTEDQKDLAVFEAKNLYEWDENESEYLVDCVRNAITSVK